MGMQLNGGGNGFDGTLTIRGSARQFPVFGQFVTDGSGWCDTATSCVLPEKWDMAILETNEGSFAVIQAEAPSSTITPYQFANAIGCVRHRQGFRVISERTSCAEKNPLGD